MLLVLDSLNVLRLLLALDVRWRVFVEGLILVLSSLAVGRLL